MSKIREASANAVTDYSPGESGTHTVRVTFQSGRYLGHVAFEIGGNCKGLEILNEINFLECDNQEDINRYVENDCRFTFDEETECFTLELNDEDGNM
jgi:hypothetical protein